MPGVEALPEIPPLGRLCLCPEKGRNGTVEAQARHGGILSRVGR